MSKVPRQFDKVLYLRVQQSLIDRLDEICKLKSEQNKGMSYSVAGIARTMLWEAIEKELSSDGVMGD